MEREECDWDCDCDCEDDGELFVLLPVVRFPGEALEGIVLSLSLSLVLLRDREEMYDTGEYMDMLDNDNLLMPLLLLLLPLLLVSSS